MLAEQSSVYEESWRTSLIGNIKQTMARNWYQYHWTTTKIKQQEYNCGNGGLIFKNNQTQDYKYNSIIRRNH